MKTLVQEEVCRAAIVQELRCLGIKVPKIRKSNGKQQVDKMTPGTLFGRPLHLLPMTTVDADGLQVEVSRFLFDALSFLRQHLEVEGLFRKAGSITRQKGLKRILESNHKMDSSVDAQDVACIVKQFLRELPEPLLVRRLHDAFVSVLDFNAEPTVQRRAIQIVCLLLPTSHLHTLRYLMLFFSELVLHSPVNKMTVSNLAVVLTPNILVSNDEQNQKEKQRNILLQKQMGLVQLLISNADYIGIVPDVLVERVRLQTAGAALLDDGVQDDGGGDRAPFASAASRSRKKTDKKRHTINVFHELRRMVRPVRHPTECGGGGSPNDQVSPSTPLLVATKRKHSDDAAQLSSSKKRAVMQAACLDIPVSMPPQPYFDSPDPVSKEDAISLTPGDDFSVDYKRKSGRLRIFSKGYLRRRNSTARSPKANKKAPCKESINAYSPGRKDNKVVGQRLSSGDTSPVIPVFSLVASPKAYLIRTRHCSVSALMSETSISINSSPTKDKSPVNKIAVGAQLASDFDSTLRLNPEAAAEATQKAPSKPVTKVGTLRRATTKLVIAPSDKNDDGDVDSDAMSPPKYRFTRPVNGGGTLRRGRPNTVRSGLPAPMNSDQSLFKSPKTPPPLAIDSPCPLLVDADQTISKVDSEIFEPDAEPAAKFVYDDDVVTAVPTVRKSRRSLSLTDIFDGADGDLESPGLNRSTSWEQLMGSTGEGNGEVFLPNDEPSCDVGSDVKWSRATVALRDIRELDADIENHGRPSLIRLKREKAGMVLASIKHYNDVIAKNVTEPLQEGQSRELSIRIASPVRIPPIFAGTKFVDKVTTPVFVTPLSNSKKQKSAAQQKSKVKPTKNVSTSASSVGTGRSRKLGSRSPTVMTRSSPRPSTLPQQKYVTAAVRRSPRLHQYHSADRSSLKTKAASDAYRRRAIRGQIKRRSTVL